MQDTSATIPHASFVKVRAQNKTGKFFEIERSGVLAHCLQHEIDHLFEKLNVDYLSSLKKSISLKKMEKFLKRMKD